MDVGIIEEDIFRQKGKILSTLLRSSPFPREEIIIVDTNCSLVLIRVSKKDLSGDIYVGVAVTPKPADVGEHLKPSTRLYH